MLYVAIWWRKNYSSSFTLITSGRIETYQIATYSTRTLLKMDSWSSKHAELLKVMNKINHQILCILLDYIYIECRWLFLPGYYLLMTWYLIMLSCSRGIESCLIIWLHLSLARLLESSAHQSCNKPLILFAEVDLLKCACCAIPILPSERYCGLITSHRNCLQMSGYNCVFISLY